MKEFYNVEDLYLRKDKIVETLWIGGLADLLSQHRSEYWQHDKGKTLFFLRWNITLHLLIHDE